ncbi:MAG TPA: putative sulfate exporter family transporter [bacterium]|nr:putative sulfate exporter family transporter [bacterium]
MTVFPRLPGVAAAVALGIVGLVAAEALGGLGPGGSRSPVSPVMVAILLGILVRNTVGVTPALRPGLRFAAARILRLGIVLLGIRLSVVEIARLGLVSLPVVVACIGAGLLFSALLARACSVPRRLGLLIGVGTSICGVSAIAATGPLIRAEEAETSYAVAVITLFGVLAMIVYPLVCPLLFDDPASVGLFLGTAVHDTSQVNGSALIYAEAQAAPRALDVAVVTKLLRNLFMVAVIPFIGFRFHRAGGDGSRVRIRELLPAFVAGFVAAALVRSIGDATLSGGSAFGVWDEASWRALCGAIQRVSGWCLVVALAAVGLGTDFRAMRSLRATPFLVGFGAAAAVGLVSFLTVTALGPWIRAWAAP